ncbi:MAG: DUF4878 domain-containing protein [Bdellovibrionales bacterium]|nr:DUF4878 domain-containing protein [Bdellovibrionales bacterium]
MLKNKCIITRISLLTIIVLFIPILSFASSSTPKEIVQSVVEEMKASGSPSPILDHVHWPTAYSSFPAAERRAMGVNSPEELKSHMRSVMSNPKAFMQQQMDARIGGMPQQQQEMMKQAMLGMMSQVDEKIKEMKQKIVNTEYEISNEIISGNNATVDITALLDGNVKNTTVEMRKIDGEWYFPTVDFAKESGANFG